MTVGVSDTSMQLQPWTYSRRSRGVKVPHRVTVLLRLRPPFRTAVETSERASVVKVRRTRGVKWRSGWTSRRPQVKRRTKMWLPTRVTALAGLSTSAVRKRTSSVLLF